ncbi:modification methylase [Dokdonia sinensis]|uniref:site-specific DNA-methyltransferase (adenine-specific) n=1 Tax=Dokdonia sinensis TaxID=2479847 RepID=A0A3M0G6N2_9FLAO|nr:DNA adenine methylase [Dokdonia sinensis]RMB57972.1 modification methylase [Dokdonia sinensis]
MNYIGSKHTLAPFITQTVHNVCGDDLTEKTFCDLFAGTGSVGRNFKDKVAKVIANDLEYYSYILNSTFLNNDTSIYHRELLSELNNLKGISGFIASEYGAYGEAGRNYFSQENAQKIDAVRLKIEKWKTDGAIDKGTFYWLLTVLLEAADKVANTASVYGAYLKGLKKTAQKPLVLHWQEQDLFEILSNTNQSNEVYNEDANTLIKKINGDILYLDPPYNARQYGANYHLLNTIAKYDTFAPVGKTGLPAYNKSAYCSKVKVEEAFESLIKNAQFKYIFLSYNNEGLMSSEVIRSTLEKYGRYDLATTTYQRFKADKTESRNHKASSTIEYLHILEK